MVQSPQANQSIECSPKSMLPLGEIDDAFELVKNFCAQAKNEVGCPRPDEFLARRIRDPIGNIVDNGEYDILHPGAMYLASADVPADDSRDNRYMTVASHGFLPGQPGDRVIRPLDTKISGRS
ncbi:hypothetical protein V8E54_014764 [Elaphomyces granulatus]